VTYASSSHSSPAPLLLQQQQQQQQQQPFDSVNPSAGSSSSSRPIRRKVTYASSASSSPAQSSPTAGQQTYASHLDEQHQQPPLQCEEEWEVDNFNDDDDDCDDEYEQEPRRRQQQQQQRLQAAAALETETEGLSVAAYSAEMTLLHQKRELAHAYDEEMERNGALERTLLQREKQLHAQSQQLRLLLTSEHAQVADNLARAFSTGGAALPAAAYFASLPAAVRSSSSRLLQRGESRSSLGTTSVLADLAMDTATSSSTSSAAAASAAASADHSLNAAAVDCDYSALPVQPLALYGSDGSEDPYEYVV
jgi:hypothetical protein